MVAMSKSGIVVDVGGALVGSGDWNAGTLLYLVNHAVQMLKHLPLVMQEIFEAVARHCDRGKKREKTSLYF